MLLTGNKIKEEYKKGKILLEPYNESQINPNSYNITLNKTLKFYKDMKILTDEEGNNYLADINGRGLNSKFKSYKDMKTLTNEEGDNYLVDINNGKGLNYKVNGIDTFYIDPKKPMKTYELEIPENGLIIPPNELILGSTNEKAGSDYFVPMYEGRSSTGRLGLASHITAGFGDIGFKSNWTLEILTIYPIKLYRDMEIGQVCFLEISNGENNDIILYNGKYKNQDVAKESQIYKDFK